MIEVVHLVKNNSSHIANINLIDSIYFYNQATKYILKRLQIFKNNIMYYFFVLINKYYFE